MRGKGYRLISDAIDERKKPESKEENLTNERHLSHNMLDSSGIIDPLRTGSDSPPPSLLYHASWASVSDDDGSPLEPAPRQLGKTNYRRLRTDSDSADESNRRPDSSLTSYDHPIASTAQPSFSEQLENNYALATTLEQKVNIIIEAINYFHPQIELRHKQVASRFISFHPLQDIMVWIERFKKLYEETPQESDQIFVAEAAYACWRDIVQGESKKYRNEKFIEENFNLSAYDQQAKDGHLTHAADSKSNDRKCTSSLSSVDLAMSEFNKWQRRKRKAVSVNTPDDSRMQPDSQEDSSCCTIS